LARVVEAVNQGRDVVYASVDYGLTAGEHVEVLAPSDYTGTQPLSFAGNELAQFIFGNAGANLIAGLGGADSLVGLGGDDIYLIDDAAASIFEAANEGRDVVYASVSYQLVDGQHVEVISAEDPGGTAGLDFTGNEFDQTILGNAGANTLDGRGGSDVLLGNGGADSFTFTTTLGAGNVDFIADFQVGVDEIVLDNAVFVGLGDGALPAAAFRIGTAAQDADDRIIYDAATGALYFDGDGNGGGAAIQFATLGTGLSLTASDFLVI
jgi:Ca2+-binding RTX toxin-like protein